jgi:hypothetical protein
MQVLLQVLDVGGVRVLTSVLAQSAALKLYERCEARSSSNTSTTLLHRQALSQIAHLRKHHPQYLQLIPDRHA